MKMCIFLDHSFDPSAAAFLKDKHNKPYNGAKG